MARLKALKGVLWNFLGTYVSRYSDHRGYLLFGFLVAEVDSLEFDLLEPNLPAADTPLEAARTIAVRRFAEQVARAGLDQTQLRTAWLRLTRWEDRVDTRIYREPRWENRAGWVMNFRAVVETTTGRVYERERVVWIAPHDPLLELKSMRAS